MEEPRWDAELRTPELAVPILPENRPFAASFPEKICALVMYLLAFCYIQMIFSPTLHAAWLCVFCAGFVAMAEVLFRARRRSWESWVWLSCMLVIVGSLVWREVQYVPYDARRGAGTSPAEPAVADTLAIFILHAYAIYWALCRADALLGGESGHLLALDALDGVIVFPFKHFFLRIRTALFALTHLGGKEKRPAAVRFGIAAAVIAAVVLLVLALQFLSGADARFDAAVSGLLTLVTPDWNNVTFVDFLYKFILSLPVGAYLFGLLAGTAREDTAVLRACGERTESAITRLRKVPQTLWLAVLGIFTAVYLAFFALQAGYLFGAFSRTLPEGYTVAEYARQGFFSLCRVMAVNFALLWLVTRSGALQASLHQPTRILCTALLAESLLLAVIAASKLALYIDCFGFTPRRLQSAWLIAVLAAGCAAALYSLWSRKKSFRLWLLFSGVTLALLHLF